MDRQLYDLVARLISIQAELGQVAYCRAAAAAYLAIARVALDEAESQAGVIRMASSPATVVPFPLGNRLDPRRTGADAES